QGPTWILLDTSYAERDGVVVVELADFSGLRRLPGGRPAPRTASSYGTGEVIAAALDAGCRRIVLGIGGSACTDGGAGMVQALGARLDPVPAEAGGAALRTVAAVDLSGLNPRLADVEVVIASDVDNRLLGARGAAAVYGPQKGAGPADVAALEDGLTRWAAAVAATTGRDLTGTAGAGAAGGVGFGALAVLGATVQPGIDLLLDLAGFDAALVGAELVITGEGSLDEQTLMGKAPVGLAARATAAGIPVIAVSGRCLLTATQAAAAGFTRVHTLSEMQPDPHRCMRDAGPLLQQLGTRIAAHYLNPAGGVAVGSVTTTAGKDSQ
ncbi:MAG: glycerate kinase, partial [Mycobacteriales bacterium]